jgi:hypothetical protein
MSIYFHAKKFIIFTVVVDHTIFIEYICQHKHEMKIPITDPLHTPIDAVRWLLRKRVDNL